MRVHLIAAAIGLGVAGFVPAAPFSASGFSRPPSDGALLLASLGRRPAAGAVLWILTTQQVGRPGYQEARFPHLEDWLESVFRHNPYLDDGYSLGTVLLLTDRERAPRMERLLEQAEQRHPDDYNFSMLRGISAYFGALDTAAAAAHFERASKKKGAPPYLAQFSGRLRQEADTCGVMIVNMKSLAQQTNQSALMTSQVEGVFLRCLTRELEQAATGFRINTGRDATVDDLVAQGYLKRRPPAPPGQCWSIVSASATLQPCPTP